MIRSTKSCLQKVVGQARLHYDELITALTEIEAVINSRPLTHLSPDDLNEPFTPSHFLYGRQILSLPDGLYQEVDSTDFGSAGEEGTCLSFETLTACSHRGRLEALSLSVRDIVLVEEENKPRGLWRIARIGDHIKGRDRRPRGAVLQVLSHGGRLALCNDHCNAYTHWRSQRVSPSSLGESISLRRSLTLPHFHWTTWILEKGSNVKNQRGPGHTEPLHQRHETE